MRTETLRLARRSIGIALCFAAIYSGTVGNASAVESPGSFWKRVFRKSEPLPTMEALAAEIDWLEHFIDKVGSVQAKQPDVWGEDRLTKHRQDFERIMETRLGGFNETYQAAIQRSDQSFLSSMTALSFAVSGPRALVTNASEANLSGNNAAINYVPFPTVDPLPTQDLQLQFDATSNAYKIVPVEETSGPISRMHTVGSAQFAEWSGGLSLEPTVVLSQHARYLEHLNEIRRINEGDDTADSPGYSLNLLRIPISILPGKYTRRGYGAEITITAEPVLGPETLPTTVRRLVINETIDLLAVPIMDVLLPNGPCGMSPGCPTQEAVSSAETLRVDLIKDCPQYSTSNEVQSSAEPLRSGSESGNAISASQFGLLLDHCDVKFMAQELGRTLQFQQGQSMILDVYKALAIESSKAYDMLSLPVFAGLFWDPANVEALAEAITRCDQKAVFLERERFLSTIRQAKADPDHCCLVDLLAWIHYVNSALIQQRMVRDMRESASNLGCATCAVPLDLFVGPNPSEEARLAFNEYVRCRWPIHVFAIDPVVQQQNVHDIYSRRRELQLALAMSFASGNIGAGTLNRFARRLETDMATVALNDTHVGFAHSNDTFGWRFFPRVQTPPFKGNIQAYGETLFGPRRDADLGERMLEPGPRECIALVIAPSFVPALQFDVRSNWFKITCPTMTAVTVQDSLRMSKSIRKMHDLASQVLDQDQYRPGELARMQRRVHQLDRELALQTMVAQIPVDVDVTGFELFASGVSELGPEVFGFYGEPGVALNRPTELFVVGRHFNVHQTKVIAGNYECRFDLLSRRIMKVTIPAGVRPEHHNGCQVVDLHVATPYGVSKHLKIPVVDAVEPAIEVYQWASLEEQAFLRYTMADKQAFDWAAPPRVMFPAGSGEIRIAAPVGFEPANKKLELQAWAADNTLLAVFPEVSYAYDRESGTIVVRSATWSGLIGNETANIATKLRAYLLAPPNDKLPKPSGPETVRITGHMVDSASGKRTPIEGDLNLRLDFFQ